MVRKKLWLALAFCLGAGLAAGCGDKGPGMAERMKGTEAARQEVLAALKAYHEKNGSYPASVDSAPFIGEQLPALPAEQFMGKNRVVKDYDGQGGWIYNPATGEFFANTP